MWSTPSDMARFTINVMLAYIDQPADILSHEMAVQMLTPQIDDRGLGPVLGNDGGDRFYFFHKGANDGYATYAVGYPERGQGIVIMTNSDGGKALWREILNSVSVEYGWVKGNTSLYVSIAMTAVLTLSGFLFLRKRRINSKNRAEEN